MMYYRNLYNVLGSRGITMIEIYTCEELHEMKDKELVTILNKVHGIESMVRDELESR